MINKELLSSVLKHRVDYYSIYDNVVEVRTNYLVGADDNREEIYTINIHELAHKCKEWAFGQDKYKWLFSYKALIGSWCDIVDNHNRSNIIVRFSGDTEPEAIFKACEWILEQTKQV